MTNEITIRELQGSINRRLEKYDGRKYKATEGETAPAFYEWYTRAIAEALEEYKVSIFRPTVWRIIAEIDDAAPLKVSFMDVAEVVADIKKDGRYSYGGPGKVLSLRVRFREDMLDLTISGARALLLKEEKEGRLKYHRAEREEALAKAEAAARAIAELEAVTIEGA